MYRPTRNFGGQTDPAYEVDMLRRMRPEGSDIAVEPGIIAVKMEAKWHLRGMWDTQGRGGEREKAARCLLCHFCLRVSYCGWNTGATERF